MPRWIIQPEWNGETVFIIAGGESVRDVDLSQLKGRKVVVVNSSYDAYRNADWLVFTDLRWWKKHRHKVRAVFQGRILSLTPDSAMFTPDVHVVVRQRSGGISTDPTRLAWLHTTLTTANNFVALMGAKRIALLGADGGGDWHHEPHPDSWTRNPNWPRHHNSALAEQRPALEAIGVEVFNLNPNSKFDAFKFSTLEEMLR